MKDNILKLRQQGKTYNEIQSILGCSKSTISYHCGNDQPAKSAARRKRLKEQGPITPLPDKHCLNCDKLLSNKARSYCNHECHHTHIYNEYIRRWLSGEEDGLRGANSTSVHIKNYLRIKYNNSCTQCGWNMVNPSTGKVPVELEHKDGDFTNNKEDNLDLLCPNCHSLTSTYKALNKGNCTRPR